MTETMECDIIEKTWSYNTKNIHKYTSFKYIQVDNKRIGTHIIYSMIFEKHRYLDIVVKLREYVSRSIMYYLNHIVCYRVNSEFHGYLAKTNLILDILRYFRTI